MEEISTIKKNIFYFIDYKGITKEEFYNKTGISSSNFKGINRKSEIGGDKLIKILTIYPEINAEWLITGKGSMLKKTGDISIQGNNNGIANTGIIAGSPMVGDGQNISDSNITIEGNVSYPAKETNTSDIKDLLSSYNTDKGVEIDRLQAVYDTILESKDAIILEKNNTIKKLEDQIQNLKEQIEELREDKKFLKQTLQKNQM